MQCPTTLAEEADQAEEETEFLDSLTSWTVLSSSGEGEDSQVVAMREEAKEVITSIHS